MGQQSPHRQDTTAISRHDYEVGKMIWRFCGSAHKLTSRPCRGLIALVSLSPGGLPLSNLSLSNSWIRGASWRTGFVGLVTIDYLSSYIAIQAHHTSSLQQLESFLFLKYRYAIQ
jgi:hypothetical protein